ncbi:MAG TPA: hypothetical protein VIY49_27080 [Bryobacteraceae bacterium]
MNRTFRTAAAILFFTAIRIWAHHSFAAEYDANKLATVSGILASSNGPIRMRCSTSTEGMQRVKQGAGSSKWEARAAWRAEDGKRRI